MASPTLLTVFGILGNISSSLFYLAPFSTFLKIRKRKSTMGFKSLPYVTALLNAMFWLYYAFLIRAHALPLIIINSIGCFMETIYIVVYLTYAPRETRNGTMKVLSLHIGLFLSAFLFTTFVVEPQSIRSAIVGWFCDAVTIAGFAAPLTILFQVVRTRSVEYMPIALSFSLTLNAAIWLVYGLARGDFFIAIPNICGIILGMLQIVLYGTCRYAKANANKNGNTEGHIDIVVLSTPEVHPVDAEGSYTENNRSEIKICEDGQTNNHEKEEKTMFPNADIEAYHDLYKA